MSNSAAVPPLPSPPTSRPLGIAARRDESGTGSGSGNKKMSLAEKIVSFFAAESYGGLNRGTWTAVFAAAAAFASGAFYSGRYKKQERSGYGVGFEGEKKLTSGDDWRRGKSEVKEGARDIRSAASKWARGE